MKTMLLPWMLCCAGACALAEPAISVTDLQPYNVKGLLGKPLGSRTIIAGRFTIAMLSNPLKVTEIDSTAVTNSIVISISGKVESKEIHLKKGVSYRFEGYESGEFGSAPGWLAPGAQQPFQFYSFFVVTKVLEQKQE